MRLRQKGQQFPAQELESFLIAYGDTSSPLPATIRVLDEIVTDFIIESCHEAAAVAHHARRQKIKLDDFKFMLRRDAVKLGRVSEFLETDKELKRKRKAFDTDEGAVVKGDQGVEAALAGGAAAEGKKGGEKEGGGGGTREDGERRKKKKKKNRVGEDVRSVRSG
ncbi:TFIID-18kDa-domain-containing protein [Lentithecium fluviatile CBS 122367]|uniref:Transcription initiation factor TFIID subunit 13 n=1 Tax=Lentithecium fluviatile CBS 122367 TaxID=1168545 RepID=A0A6G1JNW5_9PLEO|nr:TFIID-18kDa-domain-containing protein [Lentithecium fluviatile CBS 122367]